MYVGGGVSNSSLNNCFSLPVFVHLFSMAMVFFNSFRIWYSEFSSYSTLPQTLLRSAPFASYPIFVSFFSSPSKWSWFSAFSKG